MAASDSVRFPTRVTGDACCARFGFEPGTYYVRADIADSFRGGLDYALGVLDEYATDLGNGGAAQEAVDHLLAIIAKAESQD